MAKKDMLDEETLNEIADLANSTKQLARKLERLAEEWTFVGTKTESYGDMQKLIVSIIRGSELMFEELTGVEYRD